MLISRKRPRALFRYCRMCSAGLDSFKALTPPETDSLFFVVVRGWASADHSRARMRGLGGLLCTGSIAVAAFCKLLALQVSRLPECPPAEVCRFFSCQILDDFFRHVVDFRAVI